MTATDTNFLQPFLINESNVRGRVVRLGSVMDDILLRHNYPEPVSKLLGEGLMLAAHASYLSKNPALKVTIEGHADERGTPEYNIALGERRAEAVSNYLQALGVQADQISIVSYGEEKPLLLGQSEDVYAKNRRAVLVY